MSNICIYVYILLKAFYFFKSGSIQPADIFLLIYFISIVINKKNKEILMNILNKNYKLLIFVFFVIMINFIYFIKFNKINFMICSLYYIFNFIAVISFLFFFKNQGEFSKTIKLFKINILIQLIFNLFNLGMYDSPSRYMGTFNDPNQFAYYILLNYIVIYILSNKKNKKRNFIWLLISTFLIIQSASTGMFAAILIFLFFEILTLLKKMFILLKKYKRSVLMIIVFVICVFSLVALLNHEYKFIDINTSFIFERVSDKLSRVNVTSNKQSSVFQERGYDRFIKYPTYIFYGSGEGYNDRFVLTSHQLEIHATLPGILFYYGIIPFLFLISWIYDKMKKANFKIVLPVGIMLLESFTLANQRQVLFWLIILLCEITSEIKDDNNEG